MDATVPAEDKLGFPFPNPPAEGDALEVAPGILWMRLPLPMALNHVNSYALDDVDGWTIVDTGIGSKRSIAIWQALIDGPLGGRPVRRVLVTHHHPDHVGMAGWFQTEHGAELLMTRTAWLFARMLSLDAQERPTAEMLAFWQGAGMDPEILAERRNSRPLNFSDALIPMPLGFRSIAEGDRLHLGQRDWTVRIGNGHAPSHATLWSDDGLVLAGDQMLATITPNIGVYATEPEADPISDWLEACERLARFATHDQLVLPGHKLPFTGLPLRVAQLVASQTDALDRLVEFFQTPATASDCFPALYQRKIRDAEYGLALVEAVAHVNHLHRSGCLSRTRRGDGAWLWQTVPPSGA